MTGRVALGALSVVLLSACSSTTAVPLPPRPTHTPMSVLTPSPVVAAMVAGDPNPPAWPAEVGGPSPHLPDCNATGFRTVEGTPGGPANPHELASNSWRVVLVDADAQRAFWLPNSPWADTSTGGWESFTATNFRVVSPIKGQTTPWLQRQQEGAAAGSLPCPRHIEVVSNLPPPKVGARYLLFDWYRPFVLQPNRPQPDQGAQGPWWRFLVIDGVVHSEAEFNPQIEAMRITPQPLDQFLTSIGLVPPPKEGPPR